MNNKFKNQISEIYIIMSKGYSFEEAIEIHKKNTFESHKFMIENSKEIIEILKRMSDK